jgi:hypothetical protein
MDATVYKVGRYQAGCEKAVLLIGDIDCCPKSRLIGKQEVVG